MRTKLLVAVGILTLVVGPILGHAQQPFPQVSPAPVGMWQGISNDGTEVVTLFLGANGEVTAASNKMATFNGRYIWEPEVGGGYLTIRNFSNRQRLFYSVTYLNANTINVADTRGWYTFTR